MSVFASGVMSNGRFFRKTIYALADENNIFSHATVGLIFAGVLSLNKMRVSKYCEFPAFFDTLALAFRTAAVDIVDLDDMKLVNVYRGWVGSRGRLRLKLQTLVGVPRALGVSDFYVASQLERIVGCWIWHRSCRAACSTVLSVLSVHALLHLSLPTMVGFDGSFECSISLERLRGHSYRLTGLRVFRCPNLKHLKFTTTESKISTKKMNFLKLKVSNKLSKSTASLISESLPNLKTVDLLGTQIHRKAVLIILKEMEREYDYGSYKEESLCESESEDEYGSDDEENNWETESEDEYGSDRGEFYHWPCGHVMDGILNT
ncbi:hypothetical protein GIB67_016450 [Kingdonia uniflora]|uniref:Uncharacterized protein n=1 Tax=Kingdonia uniflora TaxID=39325 RepID=A0A7J7MHI1_9MAGN|nr:hypothetical protein GIB67_016450 [Kingdonia uniflora]